MLRNSYLTLTKLRFDPDYTTWLLFPAIIGLGVILRLRQYLVNRSLWLDEALISLNIINRSFVELATPLDYRQGAPLGFLWIEKSIITLFGPDEYALRFFPLVCGILALPIFYVIAGNYLSRRAAFFALLLFTLSGPLTYYSSEAKQYSSDVLVALLSLLILFVLLKQNLNFLSVALLGGTGALLIWTSHPAIFILASIGLLAWYNALKHKDKRQLTFLMVILLCWAASFLVVYFVLVRSLTQNEILLDYWASGFPPPLMPLTSFSLWLVDSFLNIFKDILGLTLIGVAGLTWFFGALSLYSKTKMYFFSLTLPLLFVFGAALLNHYPFSGRLLLFLAPLMIILMAEGIERIIDMSAAANLSIATAFFVGLLFFHPLIQAGNRLVRPQLVEEIEPAIAHIHSNWQRDDIIYLYYGARKPFEYYLLEYNFNPDDYKNGVAYRGRDWSKYLEDLERLKNHRRVWLLFSHVYRGGGTDEELLFLNYLSFIGGVQKDQFQTVGSAAYLYEFPE